MSHLPDMERLLEKATELWQKWECENGHFVLTFGDCDLFFN
jgi:hypothetical protein